MDKPTCAGKVWSRYEYTRCHKAGTVEHAGKFWCKTHHPPTVDAKADTRQSKWKAEMEAKARLRKQESIRKQLADRALDWMRNEDPEIVERWERELDAQAPR